MAVFRRLSAWLRRLGRRDAVERDMHDEFRFHVDSYTADLVRRGLTPDEARRRAHLEFGGVEARKEEGRDALGLRLLDELRADLRYTWRQLRRAPGFTAIAILSLALGIGANTAIFSLMEAALWKPMAVREPRQLRLFIWAAGPAGIPDSTWDDWNRVSPTLPYKLSASFSYDVFQAFERETSVFERVFAFKTARRVTALVGDRAELALADLVSGGLYEGLGVVPTIGRPILPSDDQLGRTETVAVISDGYWARRFGRDPDVIGRTIRVNQVPVTIVGVNPPSFTGLSSESPPDLFIPLTMQPAVAPVPFQEDGNLLDKPDFWWVDVMGRLKPGVTDAEAQAATQGVMQQAVRATLPGQEHRPQPHLRLIPGSRGLDNLAEDYRWPLLVLLTLVGVVLLIACANVANLLLARASARRRELSLRFALGAGRGRLTRQLLTEGLVLGLAGGALGVLLGYWVRDVVPSILLSSWAPEQFGAVFNLRVLALALAVTIGTSVLFSLLPIWQAMRVDIQASLKDGGRTMANAGHPMRGRSLVVFQVSLSVLLLIGAALFLRTLVNLRSVELGFTPEQIVLFVVDPPRSNDKETRRTAIEQIDERIAAIPGVVSSSMSGSVLVGGRRSRTSIEIVGRTPDRQVPTYVNTVGHRFFETMGLPIVRGRAFNAYDRLTSPTVAIVNQRFVRDYLSEGDPIGRQFKMRETTYEVVGVCGDTPYDRTRAPVPPTWFNVYAQAANPGGMTFEVRTAASVSAILPLIRDAVRSVDKDLPVFAVRTQAQQMDATLSQERLFVTLSLAFGVLALLLASVGIYGILAQNVSRRTSEIGLRVALGATRGNVLAMVLREASLLAVIGVIVGSAAAMGLGRYVQSMLFGTTPTDPIAIGGAIAAMLVVALAAGWLPARRACRLDPMVALRHE